MVEMKQTKKPRNFEHSEDPGDYVVITKVSQAHIDPGEKLNIQIFFSGYGKIENPKISFYPSSRFFDASVSTIKFGLGKNQTETLAIFGTQTKNIDPDGNAINLQAGLQQKEWGIPTMFFDDPENDFRIITEKKLTNAPLELDFLIDKNARPGHYSIRFAFTYFNGEKWCTSFQDTEFFIRNLIQRYESLAWVLGVLAAMATIILALTEIC